MEIKDVTYYEPLTNVETTIKRKSKHARDLGFTNYLFNLEFEDGYSETRQVSSRDYEALEVGDMYIASRDGSIYIKTTNYVNLDFNPVRHYATEEMYNELLSLEGSATKNQIREIIK